MAFGARYNPAAEIVPTVGLPPAIPFTFHWTAVLLEFCTCAVNCRVCARRTGDVAGETGMLTMAGVVTSTKTVFDVVPSALRTTTGTEALATGAVPAAVSFVDDTTWW